MQSIFTNSYNSVNIYKPLDGTNTCVTQIKQPLYNNKINGTLSIIIFNLSITKDITDNIRFYNLYDVYGDDRATRLPANPNNSVDNFIIVYYKSLDLNSSDHSFSMRIFPDNNAVISTSYSRRTFMIK